MNTDKIKDILDGMQNVLEKDQIELYKNLVVSSGITNAKSIEEFYFLVIYPFEQFTSGLIKTEISSNDDIEFIYQNYNYLDRHFEKLFETIEGTACCADKSRTIINSIANFYMTGNKIEFDYTQEYTYHLPKQILKTHDTIIEFYTALKFLQYGNPEKYLTALLNLKNSIK